MSTDVEMAARLYDNTAAAEPEVPVEPAPAQVGEPQSAADVPHHIAQLRDTPERRLFGAQGMFGHALPDGVLGADIDHAEAREVLADLGAEPGGAQMLAGMVQQAADPNQVEQWRRESEDYIRRMQVDPADLDAARRLVARDPRVFAYLEATGLEAHPRLVARAIELARAERLRGRL